MIDILATPKKYFLIRIVLLSFTFFLKKEHYIVECILN